MSENNQINHSSKWALGLSLISILGILALSASAYYFYVRMTSMLVTATQTSVAQKEAISNVQTEMTDLRKQIVHTNQEKAFLLAELSHLLFVADEKLQILNDIPFAISQLTAADDIISRVGDPQFLSLKMAINADLNTLTQLPVFDKQALWSEVGSLSDAINQLVFKSLSDTETVTPVKLVLSGWQNALKMTWEEIKGLIRVTRIEQNPIPKASMEEQTTLMQSLQFLVEQSQWAVLQNQETIYLDSLKKIEKLCQQYFEENEAQKMLVQKTQDLQKKSISIVSANLNKSLQALSQISLERKG